MIEDGATHLGVATDHVIESFRNELWADYKTGEGVDPDLLAQFHPLEEALGAMGIAVWPMVELEADDGLASAARLAGEDERVERVCIWANDKDLAQCVRGERIVQVDRRNDEIRDAAGVREKFGVPPELIPDFLALVGDAQDGFPGIRGIGKVTAGKLLNRHGPIEGFPGRGSGRRESRAGAAVQGPRDAAHRRAAVRRRRRAPVARSGRRVRGVGGADRGRSVAGARRKGGRTVRSLTVRRLNPSVRTRGGRARRRWHGRARLLRRRPDRE